MFRIETVEELERWARVLFAVGASSIAAALALFVHNLKGGHK